MRTSDGRVEVRDGLVPGDSLVVRGAEALREGVPLRVVPPGGTRPDVAARKDTSSPDGAGANGATSR
jgi:multidrug efflux system membrane fusion protein